MDPNKRRNLILFIGALFVALIFITSYAAFSNNGTNSSSTSTIVSAKTFFVTASANAVILNYSYLASIYNVSANQTIKMNATLDSMQSNGTVSSYFYSNSTYRVILQGINAYQLSLLLHNTTNAKVGSLAYLRLPKQVNAYYTGSSSIPVTLPSSNYSVFLNNIVPPNTTIPVTLTALITANGLVYNNQVRITLAT
jgi:hypothetical protein